MKEVAIIGAGISGLLTAYYLSGRFKVTIYEKENEIGGTGRSINCAGFEIEKYNHFFSCKDSAFIRVLSELGLNDRLFWKDLGQAFIIKDEFVPLSNFCDFLNYPALGLFEKMRLAGLILNCNHAEKALTKENVRSWVKRTCAEKVFEKFFMHFFKFKFGEFDDINAVYLRARIREQKNNRIGYIRGGSKLFFERLGQKINKNNVRILLNTPVSSVVRSGEGKWRVNAEMETGEYDIIVSCLPFIETLRLSQVIFPLSVGLKEKICFLSINSFLLELDRPLKERFWLYMAQLSDSQLRVVVETTAITGKTFVYFPLYGRDLITGEEETLVFEDCLITLKKINKEFERSWIKNKFFFRDRNTEPILNNEYLSLLKDNPVFEKSFYVNELLYSEFYLKSYNSAAAISKRMSEIIIKDHAGNNPG